MKNLILCVLFVLCFTFSVNTGSSAFSKVRVQNIESLSEIDRVEWICIDNQWYKIIYYTDGRKEIYPVTGPQLD